MEFVIHGNGSNESTEMQVDPSFQAARFSLRPIEIAPINAVIGGHYSIGMVTGLIAAGIADLAEIFQMRWGDTTKMFGLKKMTVQFSTATGFAATSLGAPVELIIGHGSTANGTGGTAASFTGNQMRGNMAPTAFLGSGGIRIASTAALVAATGQTLEGQAIGACMGADNRTLVSTPPFILFDCESGDHPRILTAGDTAVIRTKTPAATGTWYMSVTMKWFESVVF